MSPLILQLLLVSLSDASINLIRPGPPVEFPLRNIQRSIDVESNSTHRSNFTANFQDYYRSDGYVLNLPRLNLERAPNPYPNFIESDGVVALNLADNNITHVTPNSFDSVPNLQYLDLSYNRLAFCDFFSYGNCLENLATLVIENNKLSSDNLNREITKAGCFPSLRNLYLRNDRVRKLNFCLKQSFPNLVTLFLSDNEIDDCAFIRDVPASLAHLHIERNRIWGISKHILCHLRTLQADGNIIRSVCLKKCSQGSLQLINAKKLEVLSLANNKIVEIEACAFQESVSLESLNLAGNGLEQLHAATFSTLRSLKYLNLDDNRLKSWPNLNGNWHLKTLSIRNNKLAEIRKELFTKTTSLQKLFLGKNCIRTMHSNAFEELGWLEELDLSTNQIESLPYGWMQPLKSLKYLDLRGNYFKHVYQMSLGGSMMISDLYLEGNELAVGDKSELKTYFPYGEVHLDGCTRRCAVPVVVNNCGPLIRC